MTTEAIERTETETTTTTRETSNLILTRKPGEFIRYWISPDEFIDVTVIETKRGRVKLSSVAPRRVTIERPSL